MVGHAVRWCENSMYKIHVDDKGVVIDVAPLMFCTSTARRFAGDLRGCTSPV